MVEVRWTKQALNDIDHIAEFIANDSEYYASVQVKRFFAAVKVLEKRPTIGKRVPEKQDSTL
jgi:plasmid stabilization system protein ParE